KRVVTSQSEELQALEARIRETDERLARAANSPPSITRQQRSSPGGPSTSSTGASAHAPRAPS
ncbi:hypothetical protein LTR60_005844, partial [Cryomyces antarcticus]